MRLLLVPGCLLLLAAGAAAQPPGWVERRHPDFGWRISHPSRFKAADFLVRNRVTWRGSTIANFEPPEIRTWPDEHAGFPPSAVVVRFAHRDGGPAPRWGPRDSRFPLTLDRFKPRVWRPWRWLWFQAAGIEYEAWVWIGARASRADVEAVRGVIRSFRPEPLRSRTTSGCRFYVLDYLRSYRVGSVRRYDPHQLPKAECLWHRPFYLVRGRQGPYTISWDSTMPGGYKHCSVRYSVRRSQFFCPNGARWDLRGRVVHNPDPAQYKNDPLDMRDAVVAYDGHVLASPS